MSKEEQHNRWQSITNAVDELKTMKKTTVITAKDILHWQGEGFSGEETPLNELAQIIADIANGDYAIELLKQEITDQQSSY